MGLLSTIKRYFDGILNRISFLMLVLTKLRSIKKIKLFFLLIILSCNRTDLKYKDQTSKIDDIKFYNLVEVQFNDDKSQGTISIPSFLSKGEINIDNNIFYYYNFNNKSGYSIEIENLVSRNTKKLTDKQYLDFFRSGFDGMSKKEKYLALERLQPTFIKNFKIAQIDDNLIINNKYFFKRIAFYVDRRLNGSSFEGLNITNFHFVTINNGRKYSFNINYFGNDKSIADLTGLFNTIGGSITFN